MLRTIWRVPRVPRYTKLTVRPIVFRICVTCYRQKLTVWPGKSSFCAKKHLKIAFFGGHESGLPDFGRPWTPNSLTPGQLQAYPWKIGGMTVQTSYVTFFPSWHRNSQKSEFLVKRFVPENFSGPIPTEFFMHSGFRKYSWFGWSSLRFEVIVAQSEVIWKYRSCYKKSSGVAKN